MHVYRTDSVASTQARTTTSPSAARRLPALLRTGSCFSSVQGRPQRRTHPRPGELSTNPQKALLQLTHTVSLRVLATTQCGGAFLDQAAGHAPVSPPSPVCRART